VEVKLWTESGDRITELVHSCGVKDWRLVNSFGNCKIILVPCGALFWVSLSVPRSRAQCTPGSLHSSIIALQAHCIPGSVHFCLLRSSLTSTFSPQAYRDLQQLSRILFHQDQVWSSTKFNVIITNQFQVHVHECNYAR